MGRLFVIRFIGIYKAEETKKRTRVYNKLMIINAIDDDISNKNDDSN